MGAAARLRGFRRHVVEEFRPDSTLAVTIPTVDPQRGKLTGFAVQLPTLVRDEAGNEFPCRTPNGRCARSGPSRAVCPAGTRSPSRVGPGGVPSPNGLPPNASRPCGVSQLDRSGPFGTIWSD